MGWGHSIPIGEGEIGPPRSGFVHRLCIRKADEAWGEAARDDGLADTRFCKRRSLPRITRLVSLMRVGPRRGRSQAQVDRPIIMVMIDTGGS